LITIEWLEEKEKIDELVDIFIKNVGTEYITHIEIQEGRAVSLNEWSKDLGIIIKQELEECYYESKQKISIIKVDGVIKGYALLKIESPILTVEDIVVSEMGLGSKLMEFIETIAYKGGIRTIIGDVGVGNKQAHKFMNKLGYTQQTIVYCKQL